LIKPGVFLSIPGFSFYKNSDFLEGISKKTSTFFYIYNIRLKADFEIKIYGKKV